MRTSGKPWYRTGNDAWYVEVDGKQVMLCKGKANKAEAKRLWVKVMAEADRGGSGKEATLAECVDHYLGSLSPSTRRTREQVMRAFVAHVGKVAVATLTSRHVKSYLKPDWSASTARTHIKTILACLNMAARDRMVASNPLADIEKPAWERREAILSADDLAKLLVAATEPFRSLLVAMVETGCRPGEACGLKVEDCYPDGAVWLVANKTAAKTGVKMRPIYLKPELVELTRRLIAGRTTGHLFRNADGEPWTTDAVRLRFRNLRRKLGLSDGAIPYGTRHRFASDAINLQGVDSLIVAKLMGHSDPGMLAKTYFREDAAAMIEAMKKATGHNKGRGEQPDGDG